MTSLLTAAIVAIFFGGVMLTLALATRHRLGRGAGASVAGPFEEIWHPAAHRARVEVRIQDERTAEAPAPGDPTSTPQTQVADPPADL